MKNAKTTEKSLQMRSRLQMVIQSYMDRHGLSMRRLALRTGLNDGIVKDIMSGRVKNPRRNTLLGLAQVMGLSVDELLASGPLPDLHSLRGDDTSKEGEQLCRIPIVVDEPAGGSPVLVETGDHLTLSMRYVATHLRSELDGMVLYIASQRSQDGTIRAGDHVFLDTTYKTVTTHGVYLIDNGGSRALIRALSDKKKKVLGRCVRYSRSL